MTLYFTYESRYTFLSFSLFITVKTITKLNLGHGSRSSDNAKIKSFDVVVLQSIAKRCTKNYNARAQPLFRSLNLSFSDVPIAVAVVGFLNCLWSVCNFK